MATYAGVTFDVVLPPNGPHPEWEQSVAMSERLVPYADRADVQSAGRGNRRITVRVTIEDSGGLATLQAAQGATKRTLASFLGNTHTNTILWEVSGVGRYEYETRTVADLTFVREGS